MKLLLTLCLGLVALATCQESEEFLVIEEGASDDDLNLDKINKLQEDGTAAKYLKKLQRARNVGSVDDASVKKGPPGYITLAAAKSPMFEESNAKNIQMNKFVEKIIRLYDCSDITYQLRWFPMYSNNKFTNICYIPWAKKQAITYSHCTKSTCTMTKGKGQCRPSCYIRRRMLVMCFNFQQQTWTWSWVVRALPQACACSTH